MAGNRPPAKPDAFAGILSCDPVMRVMFGAETAADGWPGTEDPDECIEALLEEGEPPSGGAA